MVKKIPATLYDYLLEHPKATSTELFKAGVTTSTRTGRRHKGWFSEGAERDENYYNKKVKIYSEEVLEEDEFDVDEFLKVAPKLVAQFQKFDPVLTHDVFDFETTKPIAVMFPSCIHLGGRYTAYEEFRVIFENVLNMPNIYWGSLGDDIEGFLPTFVDAEASTQQILPVQHQYKLLNAVLGELADRNKLLFGLGSQHGGDWTRKRHGNNPVKDIYSSYGVPFFDGKAYLKFKVGKETYNIGVAHAFHGSSQWNPLQPQSKAFRFDFPNADIVVMGDKHNYAASEIQGSSWESEAGNRCSDRVLLLQSGTAKTGPDKYTIQGWSKGSLGWPIVVLYPNEHKFKWSWDLADVEYWLNAD